jgi:hypothetical protein
MNIKSILGDVFVGIVWALVIVVPFYLYLINNY